MENWKEALITAGETIRQRDIENRSLIVILGIPINGIVNP
jgi:hypothetical protein